MSKCETCGSEVKVGGKITKYYIPIGYEKGLRRAIEIVNQVQMLWSQDFNESVKSYLVDKLKKEIQGSEHEIDVHNTDKPENKKGS